MRLDAIDTKLLNLLRGDGRMSNARLAKAVGLSPSACLRRLHALEKEGIIRGYTALVATDSAESSTIVIVQISLERQTDDLLRNFEAAVRRCPEVRECYLMAGMTDYLLHLEADGMADYERLHTEVLSRLPGVARIQSNFAIRNVMTGPLPPARRNALR
jgi:DNA-binding Lrp family transcriptional regulator